ncbi:methyltransferase domain-containing protein [Actinomadura harenae]|uniref:Protein-L-isoaspartate O-methyltransferase n=1 Tax=Actinomadura harenae TaxID=2483351 RepID=A0A3M2LSR7_9ACTN|nr:methyltransferase domain-containing protein [Actinomadura harenae]RMI39910.1 methyltransferase domain-containing protein [Actinomadura harenae]
MDWKPHAARLAEQVTHTTSRWRPIVESVPRHVFVPRWWSWDRPAPGPYGSAVWSLVNGPADRQAWFTAAYTDRSRVTRVGALHADDARADEQATGSPTSSATLPGLVVTMFQHARIVDGLDVLDVGTGSGYGTALLAERLGDARVTSVDVDPYLVAAADERLDRIGHHPTVRTVDATGPLDGEFDRIVATVAVRPIPASWLAALRPGGRLVTTIAGTNLLLTADRTPDGGAQGRIEWDRAGFMTTRTGLDYPDETVKRIEEARTAEAEPETSPYPVLNVMEAWEPYSMLGVTLPGLEHDYQQGPDDLGTAIMTHGDGSWARATGYPDQPATVHQGGPRRLWSTLDGLRSRWLRDGSLPVYGARASITPDGTITLRRGRWSTTITT